ncbi:hypothetical protein ACF09C_25510 [Streptomyces sp. NPDC014870]|uniref:hypothetical protein n=1 Tax=Streptomyces sp. NPDC014870 TaxID=3364925 RepID=UPI0036FDF142
MSNPKTTMAGPVQVPLPPEQPGAVPGCRECLGLAVKRANAWSKGDYSKVSDANVSLRAHLRHEHGGC